MKQLFPFILLISAFFSAPAQTSGSKTSSRFVTGFIFSPDFTYRKLYAKNSFGQMIIDVRDSSESPRLGFTGGLKAGYRLNSHLSLESGLLFSDKGENRKTALIDPEFPDEILGIAKTTDHFYYLCIPFIVRYGFSTGKLNWFVFAGVSADFSLYIKFVTIDPQTGEKHTAKDYNELSALTLSLTTGGGISYKFDRHWSVELMPVYRQNVLPVAYTSVRQYLYSVSLNTGIFYHF